MFNLTVTGPHTYYVGDDTFLVHNCPLGPGMSQAQLVAKVHLSHTNPATLNKDMTVVEFIAKFRQGSVRSQIGSDQLNKTVQEVLLEGNSTIRRLLTDGRSAR